MILKSRLILVVILAVMGATLHAQDIHFTQFNLAPLTYNPALTGAFYGTARVGGIFRDQWRGTYSTPSFYADAPIIKGFREQDWVGVGLMFYQDKSNAGYLPFEPGQSSLIGTLTTGGAVFSGSYHFSFDEDRNTVLALGVQGGTLSRKVEGEYQFEDQILNGGASMDMLPEEDSPKSFLDISVGLTLTGKVEGQSYYRIGLSTMHVNQPAASLLSSGSNTGELPMRLVGYGSYYWDVNEKFMFQPSVLFQALGPATEIAVQGMVGYKIPKESVVVKGGLGYRLGDALELLVGIDYKDLRVGASYDVTLSDLSTPNGAIEIGASYIIKIYKRPKIDPVIFCPRF